MTDSSSSTVPPSQSFAATVTAKSPNVGRGGRWQDGGLVFTREDGTALRPEFVTRHFARLSRRAGLPTIRLHDLRHTSASLALDAGVDLKVVSDRLGHSQLAITADLYTHVNRRLGKAASEQIAATLRPAGETLPAPFLPHDPQNGPPPSGESHDSDPASTASNDIPAGQRPESPES